MSNLRSKKRDFSLNRDEEEDEEEEDDNIEDDNEDEEQSLSYKTENSLSDSLIESSEIIKPKKKIKSNSISSKSQSSSIVSKSEFTESKKESNKSNSAAENAEEEEYIKKLKAKINSKNEYIKEIKGVMESEDIIKQDMIKKINELRDNVKNMKNKLSNMDNFDDDELNELIKDMDKDTQFKVDHKAEDHGFAINIQDNKIPQNYNAGSGNALMNDYQTRIYLLNSKSCWGRFKNSLKKFQNYFVPFKSEIKYLFARFDRNVSGMFEFFRFLFVFNIFIVIAASYMLINHLVIYTRGTDSVYCKLNLPCAIFYSRFTENEQATYSFTFIAVCFTIFFGIVTNWTDFTRLNLLQSMLDTDSLGYSKLVFNLWDWNVNNSNSQLDTTTRLKNIFTIGVSETIIKENIKRRTTSRKCLLFSFRLLSLFLSLIILAFDIVGVVGLYLLQAYLLYNNQDGSTSFVKTILISLIPGVGLSVLNAIIPMLFQFCVTLEKWDFNSTKLIQLLWRVYVAKLFTIGVVYVFLIMFLVLELTPQQVFGSDSIQFSFLSTCPNTSTLITDSSILSTLKLIAYTNYNNCKEDQFSMSLFLNLLINFFSLKLTPLVMFLFRYIYFFKMKKKENYKSPYDVIVSATNVLIINVQIYMLFPYFPYILFLSPFMIYLEFKFQYWSLKYLSAKPNKLSLQDKTGYFLMTLFSITMIIILIIFLLYYMNSITHAGFMQCYTGGSSYYYLYNSSSNCGPYKSLLAPKTAAYNAIATNAE